MKMNNFEINFLIQIIIISIDYLADVLFAALHLRFRHTDPVSSSFLLPLTLFSAFLPLLFYSLSYKSVRLLFLCLDLSVCVTVWRFVLCSVHAIPGRKPDGPRLRRNVKGPRNPMSISIQYA